MLLLKYICILIWFNLLGVAFSFVTLRFLLVLRQQCPTVCIDRPRSQNQPNRTRLQLLYRLLLRVVESEIKESKISAKRQWRPVWRVEITMAAPA